MKTIMSGWRMNILMDGSQRAEKGSFDEMNRKKLPKGTIIPERWFPQHPFDQ